MKHFLIALLLVALGISGTAQNTDFNLDAYTWSDEALGQPLMDSVGYHTSLHWRKVFVEITDEGPVGGGRYRLKHDLRQVNDMGAVDSYNKIYLPVRQNEKLVRVNARVIVNGQVVYSATQDDMTPVTENDAQYLLLALEKVAPGCYIETIITVASSITFTGDEYLQDAFPIRNMSVTVIRPEDFELNHRVYNASVKPTEATANGRSFLHVQYAQAPPFQEEDYCYTDARIARFQWALSKVISTGSKALKWTDLGMRFFENTFANYEKSKSGVKKLLKQIGVDKMDNDAEKVYAIEHYLKTNVQVMYTVPTEEIATNVLKSHTSSAFGFNRLLAFCFKEAGIPFEMLVTCPRSEMRFDKTFENDMFFSELCFYFPTIDQYMTPQDEMLRSPVYTEEHFGQDCVRIKLVELGGQISPVVSTTTIKPNKLEDAEIFEEYTVDFINDNASTRTNYHRRFEGPGDQGIRALYYFVDEETKKEFIESFIKSGQPNCDISDVRVGNYNLEKREEYTAPFDVQATMTGSDLLEFAGEKVIFRIGNVIGEQAELYNKKARQNGVDVDFLHVYRRTIRVNIPDGYSLQGLDALRTHHEVKEGDTVTTFFTSDYTLDGNQLTVTITEQYGATTYPLELYPAFAEVVNAAADFNKVSLVLEKK